MITHVLWVMSGFVTKINIHHNIMCLKLGFVIHHEISDTTKGIILGNRALMNANAVVVIFSSKQGSYTIFGGELARNIK